MTLKLHKLLIICVLNVFVLINSQETWHWTWNCREGLCVRSEKAVIVYNHSSEEVKALPKFEEPYDSIEICRLLCGKRVDLWPQPTITSTLSKKLIPFHPNYISFDFESAPGEKLQFLNQIKDLFIENLKMECGANCYVNPGNKIIITIKVFFDSLDLVPNVDESYALTIKPDSKKSSLTIINLTTPTVFGVRNGLETLSQLVAKYTLELNDGFSKPIGGLAIISEAKILDKPKFSHRGLLIDTARNYLSINTIKRQLDAMAASKLNVLHWHMTDSQSFPLDMPRIKNMSMYGAYSKEQTYTKEDITELKKYGKVRGIMVILEIDMPAHVGNGWQWGEAAGLGNLAVCVNQQPWREYCIQPPCGQLNPVNLETYNILQDIFTDLQDVQSPSEYFHMGGDEVFIPCWNNTDEIVTEMLNQGFLRTEYDFLKLWSAFQEKALHMLDAVTSTESKMKTTIILWSSRLTAPEHVSELLPEKNRTIIQTWVPAASDLNRRLLEQGYKIIISTKDAWYLDHGLGHGAKTYHNWKEVYDNEILDHPYVLGGEVCMWGELVADGSIDPLAWPRAAAAAERLWSNPSTNAEKAEARFSRHRNRLLTRGIAAGVIMPGWCAQNEGECS